MQLQTTHNNATTQMQRELDALRESQRMFKEQVRELEMGNDDLERNERYAFYTVPTNMTSCLKPRVFIGL
jgi:hypothetical protein